MIRINLLPTKAARRKESVIQQLAVGGGILVLFFFFLFAFHSQKKKEEKAQRIENSRLQEEINQLATVIAQVEDFKKKKADRNSKIEVIKKLNQGRSGPVKLLDEFTYTLPDKLWVTSFKESNKKLDLNGVGLNGAVIADFIENLRNSKFFSNVTLESTQLQLKDDIDYQQFIIKLDVNYTPD